MQPLGQPFPHLPEYPTFDENPGNHFPPFYIAQALKRVWACSLWQLSAFASFLSLWF